MQSHKEKDLAGFGRGIGEIDYLQGIVTVIFFAKIFYKNPIFAFSIRYLNLQRHGQRRCKSVCNCLLEIQSLVGVVYITVFWGLQTTYKDRVTNNEFPFD